MHDFNVGDKVWDIVKARKGIVRHVDDNECSVENRTNGDDNRHEIVWDGDVTSYWSHHKDIDLVPYSNASSPDEVAIDEVGGSEKPVEVTLFKVGDVVRHNTRLSTGVVKTVRPESHSIFRFGVEWNNGDFGFHSESSLVYVDDDGGTPIVPAGRVTSPTGAAKELKPARHSLIPTAALNLLAEHYGKGAAKYGDTPDEPNWRKGYNWSQSYDALQRHATAFWGGEDLDPETELPHMSAVVFHAFSLLTFMQEHPEFDDRYKR